MSIIFLHEIKITLKSGTILKKIFLVSSLFISLQCQQYEAIVLPLSEYATGITTPLRGVFLLNEREGYAVGGQFWQNGVILQTRDGGNNWVAQTLNTQGIKALRIDTEGYLWAIGNDAHTFRKTPTDSILRPWTGARWQVMNDVAMRRNGNGLWVGGQAFERGWVWRITEGSRIAQQDTFKQEITAACWSDDSTAHLAAYGTLFRSANGGKTWQQHPALDDFFQAVCFPTPSVGYAVGWHGTILKTTNGGQNWEKLRNGDALTVKDRVMRAVAFVDAQKGFIVGDEGLLLSTSDGGETWKKASNTPQNIHFYSLSIQATPRNRIWITASEGKIFSFEIP